MRLSWAIIALADTLPSRNLVLFQYTLAYVVFTLNVDKRRWTLSLILLLITSLLPDVGRQHASLTSLLSPCPRPKKTPTTCEKADVVIAFANLHQVAVQQ